MDRSDTVVSTRRGGLGADRFGMSNVEYDIVQTLSNLLQAHEVLVTYAADADQAGDSDTATTFRTLQENNRTTVQQLRKSLARHVCGG
jgi:hypothetical protein